MAKRRTLGQMVRAYREAKKLTRPQLAKKLDLSPGFLGHIECDNHVQVSERVVMELKKALGLKLPSTMLKRHNDFARRWNRNYRLAQ